MLKGTEVRYNMAQLKGADLLHGWCADKMGRDKELTAEVTDRLEAECHHWVYIWMDHTGSMWRDGWEGQGKTGSRGISSVAVQIDQAKN